MSFYGSVYYQLIDAFHKVIVNNKGKSENNKFADATNYKNGSYVQAEGRKGVITLDSGNAWIGLTKENDGDNSIKIWHRKPQPLGSSSVAYPFKKLTQLPSGATATTLKEADIIESCTIQYDEAGHATFTPVYYKLPKTDTTTEIANIKNTIGMDNVPAASKLPAVTEESSKNLYGYIAKNKADIDTASNRIDTIEKNTGTDWPYANFRERSITDIIGDYRKVYNSQSRLPTDNNGFKSLSEIIGNFYSISTGTSFDTDPVNKPADLTAAILALKKLLEKAQEELIETDENMLRLMGSAYIPAGQNLYTEITKLDDKIDTTKEDLETNINNKESALTKRLDGHESRIKKAEDSIELLTNGVGTEEIDSVNELIEYVNKHGPEVTGILDSINNVPTQISTAIADYNTNTVQPLADLVGKESVSTQISTAITNYNTNTIKPLADLVGDTKVSDQISTAITNYDTNTIKPLADLVGDEEVSQQISTAITNYHTNTIEPLVELIGDKDVPSQIEEALTLYTENSVNPAITKAFTDANLSQYVTEDDLGEYTTKDELNTIEGNIMEILGSREDDDTETVFEKLEKLDNYILKSEIDTYIANSIGGWQSDVDSQIEDLKKQLKELTGQTDDGSEGGSEGSESGGNTEGTESGGDTEGTDPEGTEPGTDPEGDIE